jgi:integrase
MAFIFKRKYRAPDGTTRTCRHYSIQYRDPAGKVKRIRGYRDLTATKQKAAQLEKALAHGETGLVDPFKEHRHRGIIDHLDDWLADRRTAGKSAKYLDTAQKRLNILITDCGWEKLADVEPNSFLRWRERHKKTPRNGTRKNAADTPPATSAATLNQYLDTARAFLNWCVQKHRLGVNELAAVDKVDGPKVRLRRALTEKQVATLLAVAPADRTLIYRLALAAGLRRDELEQLQWGDLRLAATRPYIQLRAEATKAGRADRLELQQTLAADLRTEKPASARDGERVFPRVPTLLWWKHDLAAAGIPYFDDQGQQADFHGGTRKTLCSRMHKAGVPLAVAMRRMRHTDARLTLVDYTDDEQIGVEAAVLPEVRPAKRGASADASARKRTKVS